MKSNKGFTNVVFVIVIIVATAGLGYFAFKKSGAPATNHGQNQVSDKFVDKNNYSAIAISLAEFNSHCKTIPGFSSDSLACDSLISKKLGCAMPTKYSLLEHNVFREAWWEDAASSSRLYYCHSDGDKYTSITSGFGGMTYLYESDNRITAFYNWDEFMAVYLPNVNSGLKALAISRMAGFDRLGYPDTSGIKKIGNGYLVPDLFYDYGFEKCLNHPLSGKYEQRFVDIVVNQNGRIELFASRSTEKRNCLRPIQ